MPRHSLPSPRDLDCAACGEPVCRQDLITVVTDHTAHARCSGALRRTIAHRLARSGQYTVAEIASVIGISERQTWRYTTP